MFHGMGSVRDDTVFCGGCFNHSEGIGPYPKIGVGWGATFRAGLGRGGASVS